MCHFRREPWSGWPTPQRQKFRNLWNQAHRIDVSSSVRLRQGYVSIKSDVMRRMGFAVLTLVLLAGSGWADEWSRTYNISNKAELKVETTDASINVDTWDKNTIEANVTTKNYKIGEGGITIEDRQAGDAVAIILRFPHEHLNFSFHGNRSVEITIHM